MRRGIFLAGAATLLAMTVGSATPAAVTVERVTYQGWADAYRLSNGTVDLIVVPSVARIMRYGFIGGPNVLWNNPTSLGKPIPLGEWPNTGGDQPWPWPQADWPIRTGRGWPPPAAMDQAPQQIKVVSSDTLRLTSSLVAGYGLRVVRDIRLASTGTQATIQTRFEKVRSGAQFPVAVWTITQLPAPDFMLARLLSDSTLQPGYKFFSETPWKTLRREGTGALYIERPTDKSAKIGMDADLLAWVKGDLLYTQKAVGAERGGGAYQPGDRAQIYSHPDNADDLARGITPYIELELTAPLRTLTRGQSQTLEVVWELRRLPAGERVPASVVGLLPRL